jgi:hypothetical protein
MSPRWIGIIAQFLHEQLSPGTPTDEVHRSVAFAHASSSPHRWGRSLHGPRRKGKRVVWRTMRMWFIGAQETRAVPLDEARPLALGSREGHVGLPVVPCVGRTHTRPTRQGSRDSRSIVHRSFLSYHSVPGLLGPIYYLRKSMIINFINKKYELYVTKIIPFDSHRRLQ